MCTISIDGKTIKGTKDFLTKFTQMLNKLDPDSSDGCKPLPDGCTISDVSAGGSYRPGDAADSAHKQGMAVDICCSGTPDPNSCGMSNVSALISSVSGFNTLRECTKEEKTCTGNDGACTGGMVQIDNKSRGSGQPTSGCNYQDCKYPNCTPSQ